MTLTDFYNLGWLAYFNDGPRAAIQHREVADALAGREVGDPMNLQILGAFNRGWSAAADEAARAALASMDRHTP